jgi:Asp-tRNA(Asn)/Glu-tRNA(Gln) amidotransferase B subunit
MLTIICQEKIMYLRNCWYYLRNIDGDMEKGSLRCDANVSVKPVKQKQPGTSTEIKNLNSIGFVRKAIDYEIRRQTALLKKGAMVKQMTLRFDESTGKTIPLRMKEEAHDYRITDFSLTPKQIATLINLVDEGKIGNTAAGLIFKKLLLAGNKDIHQVIADQNLYQTSSGEEILLVIRTVLARFPEMIKAYKKGKKGLTGFFMGEIMKMSGYLWTLKKQS